MSNPASTLPISVLGGYLGAGKTTLLNRVLKHNQGKRLGVLVNDFGAINIDAELIDHRDNGLISLSNGCACCSVADDVGQALRRISTPALGIEHVLFEASGVADPWKLAEVILNWPGFALTAVVVAADATDVVNRSKDKYVGRLIQHQLSVADTIVVCKTDLVDGQQRQTVLGWLDTQFSQANIELGDEWQRVCGQLLAHSVKVPQNRASELNDALKYAHQFRTVCIENTRVFEYAELVDIISDLPDCIVRLKGLVLSAEQNTVLEVHLAAGRTNISQRAVSTVRPQLSRLMVCWTGDIDIEHEMRAVFGTDLDRHAHSRMTG